MSEERICPNCHESVEVGASYCGNCGHKLGVEQGASQAATIQQVYSNGTGENTAINTTPAPLGPNVPAYAIPQPHHKQHWAAMALAFGVLGIGATVLMPILGLALGIVGIVLATSSYKITHGSLRFAGLLVPALAVLVGLGFLVNAVVHNPEASQAASQAGTSNGVATVSVTTPCYSLSFSSELNVNNASGSCSMNAYNGPNFDDSSSIYKVVANQTSTVNSTNFDSFSKQAIANDISKNLPGFKTTNQSSNLFAGSPAYYIEAYDSSSNVSAIEETILHDATNSRKDNFFVIVHAVNGQSISLNDLEKTWQWSD